VPFAPANGIEIAYEETGDAAAPVILLIMGLGASLTFWPDALVEGLASRGFRVVRFDNRDFGLSTKFDSAPPVDIPAAHVRLMKGEKVDAPYGLPDMAKDAIGLLDALGIDKAHIAGASMGGMIAQIIAADHQERVRSLVSIMSTSGDPKLPQGKPEAVAVLTLPQPPAEDRAANIEHGIRCQRAIGSSVTPSSEEELRDKVTRGYDRSNYFGGVPRQLLAVMTNGSRVELLKRIAVPTLVIHGTDDPLIPAEGGKDTAAHVEGAELMLVEGMGHDFPAPLIPMLVKSIAKHCRKADEAAASVLGRHRHSERGE
jgi:pimeloyl-ACP methyl ester carboxylesterase